MKKNLLFIFLIIFLSLPLFSFAGKIHVVKKVLFTYLDVQGGTAYVILSDGFGDKTGTVTEVPANITPNSAYGGNDPEYTSTIAILEDSNSSDADKTAAIQTLNNILAFSDYEFSRLVPDGFGGTGIQVREVIDMSDDYVTPSAPISSITLSAQTSPTNKCNADSCQVDVNEEVKFTAIGSGNLDSSKGINWLIDDTTPCSYHDNWGEDCGIFIDCHKKSEVTSSQCADGTICYLYGNQCLKLEPSQITLLNQMQPPTLPTLPNAKCECINNTCQLKYGEMMFLNRIKQLISGIFTQQAQAVNLSSTLTYSWSKKGTYNVYVEGKDINGNTVMSNTVTINVGVPPTTTTTLSPPPPKICTLNLYVSPTTVILGKSFNLNWSVGEYCNTDTCKASVEPIEGGGTWTGNPYNDPVKSYTTYTTDPNGYNITKITPTAKGTYTYKLECNGVDASTIGGVISIDIKVITLPIWREIIPNLGGFLKGLFR